MNVINSMTIMFIVVQLLSKSKPRVIDNPIHSFVFCRARFMSVVTNFAPNGSNAFTHRGMRRHWQPHIHTIMLDACTDGLVQNCSSAIFNALELLLCCTKPPSVCDSLLITFNHISSCNVLATKHCVPKSPSWNRWQFHGLRDKNVC